MNSLPLETEGISSNLTSSLMTLPNELFFEVALHLESFQDLNSLLRVNRFFNTLFRSYLYRRAVAVEDSVREDIVLWVLSEYRLDLLTLLLDNGLSVHQKLGEGFGKLPLLQWICEHCHDQELSVPLAQLLIERGADIAEKAPIYSSTGLHAAVFNGNYHLAALLLSWGADVNAATAVGCRALHFAVQNPDQDPTMFDLLIAHGATVDARESQDTTPLLLAAFYENTHLIPVLLRHGADAHAYNKQGYTPLHFLYRFDDDDQEVAKSLLEHHADVNAADDTGYTPLHWACNTAMPGEIWKVKLLLENGADVDALTWDECSPLRLAFNNFRFSEDYVYRDGAVAVIRLLIAHGADVSVLDSEERALAVRMGISQ
jgi:hypothetical protein